MFVGIGVSVSPELSDARGSPALPLVAYGCDDTLRDVLRGATRCTCTEERVSWMVFDVGNGCNAIAQRSELTRRSMGDETYQLGSVGCPDCHW